MSVLGQNLKVLYVLLVEGIEFYNPDLVTVLLENGIMELHKIANLVIIDVLPVIQLLIANLVKIRLTELDLLVLVFLDGLILGRLIVKNVVINALLVLVLPLLVILAQMLTD